jgi:uncharacterized protein YndB with AHSA1/START domain
MSPEGPIPGDQARASVRVAVDPSSAFRIFTEEIDSWWRRGPQFREAGSRPGTITLEPGVGGRLFESFETARGPKVVEKGRVTAWSPPSRLVFDWRASNFAPDEVTEVEIVFQPAGSGTLVTVTHRGWSHIRPDHPVRHREDVPAFIRMIGLWWGDLLTSMRHHSA